MIKIISIALLAFVSVIAGVSIAQQQPTIEQQLSMCQGQLFAAQSSSGAIQNEFGNKVGQININVEAQMSKLQSRIKELEDNLSKFEKPATKPSAKELP